jgi:EXPERA (EXPanded EBP superfamily)
MKVLSGTTKTAFLFYFASHVPITILIDGQGAFSTLYPQLLRDLVQWYCTVFGDVLMRYPSPIWFQSVILAEVFFQLPFFFVALGVLWPEIEKNDGHYPRWFQTLCIIYGAHVSTTLVPILGTFCTSSEMTNIQVTMTTAVYLPYLLFPLYLLYLASTDDLQSMPLGGMEHVGDKKD